MFVEDVLVLVRDQERGVAGITVQGDVVGRITPASAAAAKFFQKLPAAG